MRFLPMKLAMTGGVAAFLIALPVSISVSRSNATAPGHESTVSIGLKATPLRQSSAGRDARQRGRRGQAVVTPRGSATLLNLRNGGGDGPLHRKGSRALRVSAGAPWRRSGSGGSFLRHGLRQDLQGRSANSIR